MKPLAECLLYTFVDTAYLAGRDPAEVARQLCDGGADLIQIRAKDLPGEEVFAMAKLLLPIVERAGVWLVVNDYAEVAERVGAPLCHLGQADFFGAGYHQVQDVIGDSGRYQVGLSSHAPDEARRAVAAGAAYVAIGPVFATATKPGRAAVTLEYVRWAAENVTIPWFAIGGITLDNLEDVMAAGARRVAVVSAILQAPDVAGACQAFRERLLSGAT